MKFNSELKKILKMALLTFRKGRKKFKIICAFKEKRNSYFDPYVCGDGLLISDRANRCLRFFKISNNLKLLKTDVTYAKSDLKDNEDINRGHIFNYSGDNYLIFTFQFNQRSYIIKKDLQSEFKISENDIFLKPTEYYEKMSVMDPFAFLHNDNLYLFYSAGDTYEPDSICLSKIIDFDKKNIQKYIFNPLLVSDNRFYYRYFKVAFGDLTLYKGFYLMFYIGYFNLNRAYINVCYTKVNDFPNFKDLKSINPLISPGLKLSSVYKPCVLIRGNNLVIYFNGRRRNHESIYFTKVDINYILKGIYENEQN